MNESKNKVISNMAWRFFERCGAQGVTLVVSIIIARILDPDVYGVIALVTVFTTIIQVFVDSGLGNALIQKKNTDEIDYSTVFWFNIFVCIILYFVLFFSAPYIGSFYEITELVPVLRCMGFIIVISGVKNVLQAYIARNMMFKKFFFATLGGTIGAAVVGIYMAYRGYGIWSLVIQNVFNNLVDTIIIWLTVKWRPKLLFSFSRLKALLGYGSKLLISELIDNIYKQIRQLVIGKKYSTQDLAFYNRGNQFPALVMTNINSSIDSVLLPTMSSEQSDFNRIRSMTKRSIQMSTYFLMPLMTGIALCSENMIRIILTEKWLFAVPYMQLFCIVYAFYPINTANLNALKAIGRTDLYLKLEIMKKIYGVAILVATMNYGPLCIAIGLVLESILSNIVNTIPGGRILGYNYIKQFYDIFPNITLSILMALIVGLVGIIPISNSLLKLVLQIILGAVVYVLGSKLSKNENYLYTIAIIKSRR